MKSSVQSNFPKDIFCFLILKCNWQNYFINPFFSYINHFANLQINLGFFSISRMKKFSNKEIDPQIKIILRLSDQYLGHPNTTVLYIYRVSPKHDSWCTVFFVKKFFYSNRFYFEIKFIIL